MPISSLRIYHPKYRVGDRVKTKFGKGKVVEVVHYTVTNCESHFAYLIRYNLFKKKWCLEHNIIGVIKNE